MPHRKNMIGSKHVCTVMMLPLHEGFIEPGLSNCETNLKMPFMLMGAFIRICPSASANFTSAEAVNRSLRIEQ